MFRTLRERVGMLYEQLTKKKSPEAQKPPEARPTAEKNDLRVEKKGAPKSTETPTPTATTFRVPERSGSSWASGLTGFLLRVLITGAMIGTVGALGALVFGPVLLPILHAYISVFPVEPVVTVIAHFVGLVALLMLLLRGIDQHEHA